MNIQKASDMHIKNDFTSYNSNSSSITGYDSVSSATAGAIGKSTKDYLPDSRLPLPSLSFTLVLILIALGASYYFSTSTSIFWPESFLWKRSNKPSQETTVERVGSYYEFIEDSPITENQPRSWSLETEE
jgi:hypothetical protein